MVPPKFQTVYMATADEPSGCFVAIEEPGRIGPIVLRADHSGSHLIRLDRGDLIRMNGHESFRAAVASMSAAVCAADKNPASKAEGAK